MAAVLRVRVVVSVVLMVAAVAFITGCSSTRPSVPEVARIGNQGWRVDDLSTEITINGSRFRSDDISSIRTSASARFVFESGNASITQSDGQVQVILLSGDVVLVDPDGTHHHQSTDPLKLP